jgi:hypothetical protein
VIAKLLKAMVIIIVTILAVLADVVFNDICKLIELDKNNIIYYKMPCTACGKSGLSVNVTKPKSMILGVRNIRRTVRTVQRPRVLINQPTGRRAFILGR